MTEIWKPIPKLYGYEASNIGRIRSTHSKDRWGGSKKKLQPLILKIRESRSGYMAISIRVNGKSKTMLVHRLVAMAFVPGMSEDRRCVGHLDGDRKNNVPGNLKWVSYKENEAHKALHGTVRSGSSNHQSVLTEADVIDMRLGFCRGQSLYSLAARYGVSAATAKDICHNKYWKSVRLTPEWAVKKRSEQNARVQWFKLNRPLKEKPNG